MIVKVFSICLHLFLLYLLVTGLTQMLQACLALVFLHVHVLESNRGNICFTAVLTAPDLHAHTPTQTRTLSHTHTLTNTTQTLTHILINTNWQAHSGWAWPRKSVTAHSTLALRLLHTHTFSNTQTQPVFLSSSSCHNHCAVCPPCHQDLLWQLLWHPNLSLPFSVYPYIGLCALFLLFCAPLFPNRKAFHWLNCIVKNINFYANK